MEILTYLTPGNLTVLIKRDLSQLQGKTYTQAKHAPIAFNSKRRYTKLAIAVRVLQNTWKLVISRCCFVENGKEMYKDFYKLIEILRAF